MADVNRLTNGNIYVDSTNLLGKFDEIKLPEIKPKQTDHNAMGQSGTVSYPTIIEKLEGSIKWNCYYGDVYKKFANPYKSMQVMFRSNLETYTGSDRSAQKAYVVTLTINSMGVPGGSFKAGENVEAETNFTATYMKIEEDGATITEFDPINNIFFVDGVDLLKEFRDHIGQ
jgi:P2 family phage contractile tail tube protein